MTYLLAMVTGGMILYAFITNSYETQRLLLALAIFPGWATWALWRTDKIKRERGEK